MRACARWAAEAGERRATEARAHGQQMPGEEESKRRHKTIKYISIIYDSVSILKAQAPVQTVDA